MPDTRPPATQLKDKMCPLWQQPYSEQLKVKYAACWDALASLSLELTQATLQTNRPEWIKRLLDDNPAGHPCCHIDVRCLLCCCAAGGLGMPGRHVACGMGHTRAVRP